MAPLVVVLADALCGDTVRSGQRIDQRRFADARRADQRDRAAARTPGRQACDAIRLARIHHLDQDAREQPGRDADKILRSIRQVGFGEDDDRRHLGFSRQRQIALQPRRVEILVARRDNEQRVDIGGDQLQLAAGPGGTALEQAGTPQQAARAGRLGIDQQPIAHCGAHSSSPGLPVNGEISVSMEGPATRMRSRCTAITRTGIAGRRGRVARQKRNSSRNRPGMFAISLRCLTSISVARRAPTHEQQGNTPAHSRGVRHSAGSTAWKTKPARRTISREQGGVAIRAPAGWTQRQSPTSPSSRLLRLECAVTASQVQIDPLRSVSRCDSLRPGMNSLFAREANPNYPIKPFDCDCRRGA